MYYVANCSRDTRAASLLATRGLEAVLHKAKTHEAEAHKAKARFFGLEAEARPRGLTSLGRTVLNLISAYAPQAGRPTPEKEEFFTLLEKIVSEIDDGEKLQFAET